ncbi:GNAT family N-acetyltransferase [Nonomuraea ceibae]|uniref:GNAT family N-acetyltransferase n=1 Tax=Nonomuraea ceibae TaxID=1935170 RepID=UPI001C607EAB|nr:GNAT family N-acetyltransferase [Nonomuraea ceibae]
MPNLRRHAIPAGSPILYSRANGHVGGSTAPPARRRAPPCSGPPLPDPDVWGSGIARALLTAVLDGMRDAGYDDVHLWTLRDSTRARRFYAKHSFTETSRTHFYPSRKGPAGPDRAGASGRRGSIKDIPRQGGPRAMPRGPTSYLRCCWSVRHARHMKDSERV